jgi:starch-binding outer membrane protein, SusD/RagB family
MMKKYILYLLSWFTLGFSFTSCESLLEVEPRQSIDSETALTSPEAVTAATNGVYARFRSSTLYGRDLIAIPELLADNAVNTGAGNRLIGQSLNQPGAHLNNWQISYYAINQVNLILNSLENLNAPVDFKNRIRGQNLFLRALLYHNLLKVYAYDPTAIIEAENRGGVPLLTEGVTAVEQVKYAGRESIEAGYALVYADLEEAFGLLVNESNSRAPHFATAGAVAAVFSRVALYNGDYQRVIDQSELALNSGAATFPQDLVSAWRSEVHPESFFEIVFASPDNVGSNESLRATFLTRAFLDSTTPASHGNVVVSEDLHNLYLESDIRRELIMNGLGPNRDFPEMTKFASKNGIPNLDNVPVIRYAEVILNKAEAHARLNQWDLARQSLNLIKERAGLSPETDLEGEALIEEILNERRIELAFEGHRFFDLKRLGRDIQKEFGIIYFDDFRILNNIPTREIDVNPNLVQNRGY